MEINPEILDRYWSGQCTAEEQAQVKKWLEGAEPINDYPIGDDLDETEEKLLLQNAIAAHIRKTAKPQGHKAKRWIPVIGIAASVLFALFIMLRQTSPNEAPIAVSAYRSTLFYDSPKIRLGLRVDNLTNENYYADYYFVARQNPRSYAFNISWKM